MPDLLGMLTTIDLDNQLVLPAAEVDDVAIDWLLTPEPGARQLSIAERLPQPMLCFRLVRSERARCREGVSMMSALCVGDDRRGEKILFHALTLALSQPGEGS